ncbi:MAG TPA: DUF4936 family protein [Burkholderiaceae bacterium]|nr:DUF4936 family protein [Burkholderiaceae bacterium]
MRELFIYYRVHLQAVPAAKAAVVAMQARLRQRHPGLSARVLCRAEPDAARQTWMEIYAIDPMTQPAGITAALQAEIDAEARVLAAWIDGERHTEAFSPCAW